MCWITHSAGSKSVEALKMCQNQDAGIAQGLSEAVWSLSEVSTANISTICITSTSSSSTIASSPQLSKKILRTASIRNNCQTDNFTRVKGNQYLFILHLSHDISKLMLISSITSKKSTESTAKANFWIFWKHFIVDMEPSHKTKFTKNMKFPYQKPSTVASSWIHLWHNMKKIVETY